MAKIEQVAKWLIEGKNVRTPDMPENAAIERDLDTNFLYWVAGDTTDFVLFSAEDLLREDWECL